ncbi:hypothetical protein [Neobittarella massiliensis]|uniref:hypothetical protein n=1 Tax=Neobittarella massiliensis (ex Bilen et al. 2018) TaxID=2041842 RepID=UPI00101AEACB|nr:hypothetical protein [Neobittarella massiliensis]
MILKIVSFAENHGYLSPLRSGAAGGVWRSSPAVQKICAAAVKAAAKWAGPRCLSGSENVTKL